jgi:thiamine biosynthesis lipoprotein
MITQAMTSMGPRTWLVDGRTVEKRIPEVRFDVGGIIKGLAVDRALGLLLAGGATSALVQCGGETGCFGVNPRGQPHRLSIPDPQDPAQAVCIVADPGTGFSGSTSANYFNPVVIDGREYYHVFDPTTGQPVDTHVLSVSVVFPRYGRNALADGLCKMGIVRGAVALFPVVERLGGAALVMTRNREGMVRSEQTVQWQMFQVATQAPTAAEVRP